MIIGKEELHDLTAFATLSSRDYETIVSCLAIIAVNNRLTARLNALRDLSKKKTHVDAY